MAGTAIGTEFERLRAGLSRFHNSALGLVRILVKCQVHGCKVCSLATSSSLLRDLQSHCVTAIS